MYPKTDHSTQASRNASRSGISSRQPAFSMAAGQVSYRSAVTRHNPPETDHTYYDGGELSPYCIETLIELLRAEARLPYTTLDVDLEIALIWRSRAPAPPLVCAKSLSVSPNCLYNDSGYSCVRKATARSSSRPRSKAPSKTRSGFYRDPPTAQLGNALTSGASARTIFATPVNRCA
jgi:hypothetical protein